jgi:hypothetical protein
MNITLNTEITADSSEHHINIEITADCYEHHSKQRSNCGLF